MGGRDDHFHNHLFWKSILVSLSLAFPHDFLNDDTMMMITCEISTAFLHQMIYKTIHCNKKSIKRPRIETAKVHDKRVKNVLFLFSNDHYSRTWWDGQERELFTTRISIKFTRNTIMIITITWKVCDETNYQKNTLMNHILLLILFLNPFILMSSSCFFLSFDFSSSFSFI